MRASAQPPQQSSPCMPERPGKCPGIGNECRQRTHSVQPAKPVCAQDDLECVVAGECYLGTSECLKYCRKGRSGISWQSLWPCLPLLSLSWERFVKLPYRSIYPSLDPSRMHSSTSLKRHRASDGMNQSSESLPMRGRETAPQGSFRRIWRPFTKNASSRRLGKPPRTQGSASEEHVRQKFNT